MADGITNDYMDCSYVGPVIDALRQMQERCEREALRYRDNNCPMGTASWKACDEIAEAIRRIGEP
jgi:hypothetical protein